MIRDAKFADIPGMVLLIEEMYARSHYAREKQVSIDLKEAKRLLVQGVQRHGHKNLGGTFVQVAEKDGSVTGLIFGTLVRVYAIGNKLSASDLFWVSSERGEPSDAGKLMKNFVSWARSSPQVAEIKCGTTSAVLDDPREAGRLLERLGMKHYGEIWRLPCQES